MLARNLAAGRAIRNAPHDMVEFALLRELGGYTRETLAQESAFFVRRCLMMLQAEAGERKKHDPNRPRTARGRRR